MLNQKLHSEFLFENCSNNFSKEDCEIVAKEILFNTIKSYLHYFESHLYHNLKDVTEEQLTEMVYATKFFCRIEDAKEGFITRKKKESKESAMNDELFTYQATFNKNK